MSMGLAMKVGLGVGAATAIGGVVAHERLEHDGQWTTGNSKLSSFTQIAVLGGSMAMIGTHLATGQRWPIGVGAGVLFGGLAGNVAANIGAMIVD